METVLIIGPNFHYFLKAMKYAWEKNGFQAVVEGYDTPVHPFSGMNKWRHKFSGNKIAYREENKLRWQSYFKKKFDEVSPRLVFLLNGEFLTPDTLEYFRENGAVVLLWMFDALSRIPQMLEVCKHCDHVFCYEQTDVEHLRSLGKNACFLPQACDTNYYPMSLTKDIDILFVGDIYSSEKRKHYLSCVLNAFDGKKMLFVGVYKPWYKGFWKWLTRERRDVYTNRNVSPSEVNVLYNRARIVLNIHHEQQKNGANPKVFEICGSGAYQICDANPYVESLFDSDAIGLYHNESELIASIEDALANDKTKQARSAYDVVTEKHTFAQRVKYILEIISHK